MVLQKILALILSCALAFALVTGDVIAARDQLGPRPVGVAPSDANPDPGDVITLTVSLDKTSTSATTVQLSSTDQASVPVPTTMSVPAGQLSATIYVTLPIIDRAAISRQSTWVQVTASNSEGYATGNILVND